MGAQANLGSLGQLQRGSGSLCSHSLRLPGPAEHPTPPGQAKGSELLVYTTQALSHPGLRAGRVEPSGLGTALPTEQARIAHIRTVPVPSSRWLQSFMTGNSRRRLVNPALNAGVEGGG